MDSPHSLTLRNGGLLHAVSSWVGELCTAGKRFEQTQISKWNCPQKISNITWENHTSRRLIMLLNLLTVLKVVDSERTCFREEGEGKIRHCSSSSNRQSVQGTQHVFFLIETSISKTYFHTSLPIKLRPPFSSFRCWLKKPNKHQSNLMAKRKYRHVISPVRHQNNREHGFFFFFWLS